MIQKNAFVARLQPQPLSIIFISYHAIRLYKVYCMKLWIEILQSL